MYLLVSKDEYRYKNYCSYDFFCRVDSGKFFEKLRNLTSEGRISTSARWFKRLGDFSDEDLFDYFNDAEPTKVVL